MIRPLRFVLLAAVVVVGGCRSNDIAKNADAGARATPPQGPSKLGFRLRDADAERPFVRSWQRPRRSSPKQSSDSFRVCPRPRSRRCRDSAAREGDRDHFANRVVETAGAAHFTTSYGQADYLVLSSDHRTDALVLLGLLETNPASDLLPKVVAGLLGQRKNGHWASTQEDAFVLLALDAYFQKFEKVAPSFVARVWLGDRAASEHAFRGTNVDRAETFVPMSELPASSTPADLLIAKEGRGRLYYRLGLRYAPSTSSGVVPAVERGFSVARTYEASGDARDVTRDGEGVWHVRPGATVRVKIAMVALSERHHVALVDPLPAGFEPVNTALAGSPLAPAPDSVPIPRWQGTYHWYEHDNLRDERAEAFASLLPGGVYEYVYFARATTPGTFVVPPAKAEEMYASETFGRSAGDRVVVASAR